MKKFQHFNSNVLLIIIIFLYFTFADQFAGVFNVLEVEYDSYAIIKHCPYNSSQCKYVFYDYFKCVAKLNILGAFTIFRKVTEKFVMTLRWVPH